MCQFLRRKQATQGSPHYARLLLSYLLWRMIIGSGHADLQVHNEVTRITPVLVRSPTPRSTSHHNAKRPPLWSQLSALHTSRRQVHSAPWPEQGAYGDSALGVGTGEVEVLPPNVSYVNGAKWPLFRGKYTSCADNPLSIPPPPPLCFLPLPAHSLHGESSAGLLLAL